ncbi:MAG TPA: peptide deformylase [Phototrophicaceae bacterium]|nr:peptide deformylase [Phototrophicaceae bacterium]
MAIREIVRLDNPTLRKKALRITTFDNKLQRLIDDMIETLVAAPGVGLAAPQVAVSQRLIVVRLPDDDDSREEYGEAAGKIYVVINPEIIKPSKEMVEGVEGCLSIPGYVGTVNRHEKVTVTGLDRQGKPFRVKAEGWLARVFQHEIDHLEGRLYIDLAKEVWEVTPGEEEAAEQE